jgi:hypothetical protein
MLSILIPIYNFDVRRLVSELNRQAALLDVPCEIRCLDDASDSFFQQKNRELGQLAHVHYEELVENIGRARIRNQLSARAQYDYLIFMDGDSAVIYPDYLQKYLALLPTQDVLCGGRVYQEKPPADPDLYFHWWYGKNREQREAAERAQHPHHGFMTNNFLIPKHQFERILFDENIRQYGHEDTLFGFQLKDKDVDIVHLDNPLEHIGLEKKEVFLRKSRQAVDNLAVLVRQYPFLETRLSRSWRKNKILVPFIRPVLFLLRPLFLRRLSGKRPSLRFFDLLKLSYFLEAVKKRSFER